MFSCSKKDKRLSSAKKILMSQLGKRKRRAGNSSGEQSSTRDREQENLGSCRCRRQLSHPKTLLEDEASQSTDRYIYTVTSGLEVGGLLLESDYVPPSSESEYFPTPEKRQRVAIMQQPVDAASLGRRMFVCLSSEHVLSMTH